MASKAKFKVGERVIYTCRPVIRAIEPDGRLLFHSVSHAAYPGKNVRPLKKREKGTTK